MFYIISSASVVASVIVLIFAILPKRKKVVLKSNEKITCLKKSFKFSPYLTVFKNITHTLFSFNKHPIIIRANSAELLSFDFFIGGKKVENKTQSNLDYAQFSHTNGLVSLLVNKDCAQFFCGNQSSLKIVITKGNIPFKVSSKKNVLNFENLKLSLQTDGKVSFNACENFLEWKIENCKQAKISYETSNFQAVGFFESKRLAKENFGLPILDFEKPNFNSENILQKKYAEKCLQTAKFSIVEFCPSFSIDLTSLGFSKWTKMTKHGQILKIIDWYTNQQIKVKTASNNSFICNWWGKLKLCLSDKNYALDNLDLEKVKNGDINLFRLKYFWWNFSDDYKFIFAFGMLRFMNKEDESKWLKNQKIAKFILSVLPSKLEYKNEHYQFIRELYPFVVNRSLKEKLLVFMQNYEQMFYKS